LHVGAVVSLFEVFLEQFLSFFVASLGLGFLFSVDLDLVFFYIPLSDFCKFFQQFILLLLDVHRKEFFIFVKIHEIFHLLIQFDSSNTLKLISKLPEPITKINIGHFINNLQASDTLLD
jgi:hypothetical protein